jgi:hypothetical protein
MAARFHTSCGAARVFPKSPAIHTRPGPQGIVARTSARGREVSLELFAFDQGALSPGRYASGRDPGGYRAPGS